MGGEAHRLRLAVILCGVVIALLAAPGAALAHQSSFTYARLDLGEDGKALTYEIKLKSTDLYEALGLDRDRDASDDEIRAGAARLASYVRERVVLEILPAACPVAEPELVIESARDRYAVLRFRHRCESDITSVAVDYNLFYDIDPRHIGLLLVDGESVQLGAPDQNRFEWEIGREITGGVGFIRSGIDHILFGLDHILFLISLLLMAVVTRSEDGGWKLRPPREGFAYTTAIVTAFTIAHSMTLIAASLGWFTLPGRLVESAIAASIIYVALENVVRPDPPHRYVVTFAFGLIHGLGFAAMLTPLLPPSEVVVPLLLFNIGVELGQLTLVVVSLPLLYALARVMRADGYRRLVLPAGAMMLGTLGAIWLVERAFAIVILGL